MISTRDRGEKSVSDSKRRSVETESRDLTKKIRSKVNRKRRPFQERLFETTREERETESVLL